MKLDKYRLLVLFKDRKPKGKKTRVIDAVKWEKHIQQWDKCVKCDIGKRATNHVFASGVIPCFCLFIGEAPGIDEDIAGHPFVGKSGGLLHKWINVSQSIVGFYRWAMINTVLCRPCDKNGELSRAPHNFEIDNCSERLKQMIQFAMPYCIITMGREASNTINRQFPNIRTLHLLNPYYVLRDSLKEELNKDMPIKIAKFIKEVKDDVL